MMRRLPWKKIAFAASQVAVIAIAHAILVGCLAETDTVATILSAGSHAPTGHLLVAGAFAVTRILAALLLPGIILNHVVQIALDKWTRGSAGQAPEEVANEGENQENS